MKRSLSLIFFLSALFFSSAALSAADTLYVIDIKQDIDNSSMRRLSLGLDEAHRRNATYVILHINTYGGAVNAADSMRTAILHSSIPVIAFVDNQAASAGALISIACDSIYMSKGASIGAATVVNQNGEVMPDKYQSFMRGMMRSTAESHGKVPYHENGETGERWHRDPAIAQQMVDTANVLSFTADEAIAHHYCEGKANSLEEVASLLGCDDYYIEKQYISPLESIILFLLSPILQSIFLMMIVGGIYFEMQSPGLGLPSVIAILGAILYFSPLYIEGLAMNWEIVLFVVGIILVVLELFVFPGFGVAGISGLIAIFTSMVFAMIDNEILYEGDQFNITPVLKPLSIVLVSSFAGLLISIWGAAKLYPMRRFGYIAQKTEMNVEEGWVGVESAGLREMVGKEAVAATTMSPSGKIMIDSRLYEAIMEYSSAEKGDRLRVIRSEGGRLYCVPQSLQQ